MVICMKYTLVAAAIISSFSVFAFAETGFSGQARLGYVAGKGDTGPTEDTLAVGGKISYKTKAYRGVSAGGTFYTTHQVGSIDDNGLFLSSSNDDYSILGEAYLNAKLGKTSIKVGRQEVDTPFADTDDVGMIPNTFEGLVISNSRLPHTTLIGAHLSRWAGVDSDNIEKFGDMNGSEGVQVLGAAYEPSDKWNAQAWHYRLNDNDVSSINYLELGVNPIENLGLGLQYSAQKKQAGSDGRVWGVSAEYGVGKVTLSAAHNKVTKGTVINGFGGGPFFTSSEDLTIESDVEGQKATAFGVEYALNKLTLGARHVAFSKGEDELDLTASYEFNDKLSADLIVSDMGEDGNITRAFMNYNF
ncbi:MAG TPA: porin [Thiotrichaceae bacterium]|nr:porin [Thiotrichaceae bacterium]